MAPWKEIDWIFVAAGIAWILIGLHRIRFVDQSRRRNEERGLASSQSPSRWSFGTIAVDHRRQGFILVAFGAAWILMEFIPW